MIELAARRTGSRSFASIPSARGTGFFSATAAAHMSRASDPLSGRWINFKVEKLHGLYLQNRNLAPFYAR